MATKLKAAVAVSVCALVCACGGGGGSDDSSAIGNDPSATVPGSNDISIQASTETAEPMERIALSLGSSVDNSNRYAIEVDTSGAGTFASGNVVSVTGWVADGKLVMAAPVLEMMRSSAASTVPATFSVRVRRSGDSAVSNAVVVHYDALSIPPEQRGAPSTLLKLSLKAIFAESTGTLKTRAAQLKPGRLADSSRTLGADMVVADVQAEAILRQVFGYSTIAKPIASRAHVTAQQLRPLSGFDDIKAGYQIMFDCLGTQIKDFGAYGEAAADSCFDVSRQAVRDKIIKGLGDLQGKVALVSNMVVSLAGASESFVGRYVERMVERSEVNDLAVDFAQMALTSPDLGATPDETMDFLADKLTDKAKKLLYGDLTEGLDAVGKGALAAVDAEDALGDLVDRGADQIQALNGLVGSLTSISSDSQRMEDLSEQFGGPSAPVSGQVALGPFGSINVSGTAPTAASVCAQYPELDGAAQSAGLGSCVAILQPFFDPVYEKTTLAPLLAQFAGLDQGALLACASNPEEPSCKALIDRAGALGQQLIADIQSYQSKTYDCDGGYTKYENSTGGLTCVWASLAYTPTSAGCFAGSNSAGFDVGSNSVCMYYSRDYVQADGSCRTNYAKTVFNAQTTCRWANLPPASPAAYAINPDSGDRVTLVQ